MNYIIINDKLWNVYVRMLMVCVHIRMYIRTHIIFMKCNSNWGWSCFMSYFCYIVRIELLNIKAYQLNVYTNTSIDNWRANQVSCWCASQFFFCYCGCCCYLLVCVCVCVSIHFRCWCCLSCSTATLLLLFALLHSLTSMFFALMAHLWWAQNDTLKTACSSFDVHRRHCHRHILWGFSHFDDDDDDINDEEATSRIRWLIWLLLVCVGSRLAWVRMAADWDKLCFMSLVKCIPFLWCSISYARLLCHTCYLHIWCWLNVWQHA